MQVCIGYEVVYIVRDDPRVEPVGELFERLFLFGLHREGHDATSRILRQQLLAEHLDDVGFAGFAQLPPMRALHLWCVFRLLAQVVPCRPVKTLLDFRIVG